MLIIPRLGSRDLIRVINTSGLAKFYKKNEKRFYISFDDIYFRLSIAILTALRNGYAMVMSDIKDTYMIFPLSEEAREYRVMQDTSYWFSGISNSNLLGTKVPLKDYFNNELIPQTIDKVLISSKSRASEYRIALVCGEGNNLVFIEYLPKV